MASKPSNPVNSANQATGRRTQRRTGSPKPKLVIRKADEFGWLPWAVWIAGTVLLILLSASHQDLLLNDSQRAFERAQALWTHPGELTNWVHEYYPVGYSWMVAALTQVCWDAFTASRVLSVSAASGTLLLIFLIIRQQASGRYLNLGIAGVMMTAIANFNFLQLGTYDNTDFPAAALMLASLYWLGRSGLKRRFLISGLLLGAAYLVRYTALTEVPAVLAAIYFFHKGDFTAKVKAGFALLSGFVALGLIQFIPSTLLFGNPLYNLQAHNVWFALHGEGNWGLNFMEAVKHTSVLEIVRHSPGLFMKNYALNAYKLLCYNVFDLPVFWLWLPGVVLAWMGKERGKDGRAGLGGLTLAVAVFSAALCMAFVTPRTTLFLFPVICILAGWALAVFADKLIPSLAIMVSLGLVSVGGLYSNKSFIAAAFHSSHQPSPQQKVTTALEAAGMASPDQVLSLGFAWYNAYHPYRVGYAIPWSFYGTGAPISSPQDLESLVRKNGYRYIISDRTSVTDVPGLKRFWPSIPTNLRPDTVFIENEVCVIALRY